MRWPEDRELMTSGKVKDFDDAFFLEGDQSSQ